MALEDGRLRDAILRVTSVDSRVSNRINHLESIGKAVDAEALAYNEQRSRLEDTDIAKAIIEFNMADNIYQAALASTARILGLSLVNFL
jgi:flagellar hook-associated protein 3 FlgL